MENEILIIILSITTLFIVLLLLKRLFGLKFCVLCVSVSLTWLTFLCLYWLGKFPYPILLAILMGQSSLGIYYLLEKRLKEKYHFFRLPFLLTAIVFIFWLLQTIDLIYNWKLILFLLILWLITILFFVFRENKKIGEIFKQVIACCRDW
ncbi:MAG: hypothetical protein AUJ23_02985 [Candidatus Magasanikbacteria bacterium CG1_02_32_51]|uniref:Uncharacterized protein n=1 Tax=Candidatus Magasanikbacteria bacterium CG1_02_32_51 TaxID=1805238 RepID=A0A1J4U2P7_9BACT|nr:MAG: hypothetical protein AUJ23_02985 [Candidatus Magasanikbacteria bacterium CG1_02_32_51]